MREDLDWDSFELTSDELKIIKEISMKRRFSTDKNCH